MRGPDSLVIDNEENAIFPVTAKIADAKTNAGTGRDTALLGWICRQSRAVGRRLRKPLYNGPNIDAELREVFRELLIAIKDIKLEIRASLQGTEDSSGR